ncbi:Rossmann fold domain-containing protein [uncultured Erythrobacter sp.]|uniref:Rossmann fold domain-containing protein n=1 Tax=uncultured Erythrobacter sp. TaxID=263913 RepID=UPI00261DD55A|nr:hypothetical protein [uncultured Erythrobacter sp.]
MAEQVVQTIGDLHESSLAAAKAFFDDHYDRTLELLGGENVKSLVIALPAAGPDHDDWRRTLARDLARAQTPKRVNVMGASNPDAAQEMLTYLRNAPGVTGQYLAAHE